MNVGIDSLFYCLHRSFSIWMESITLDIFVVVFKIFLIFCRSFLFLNKVFYVNGVLM